MRFLTAFFLCLFMAAQASAVVGIVRTFNSGKTVKQCFSGNGKSSGGCHEIHCGRLRPSDRIPEDCYDVTEVEVVPVQTYNKELESHRARITELENQLSQYRQEVARSQADVITTMINDPQFRSLLVKKIKEDSKR